MIPAYLLWLGIIIAFYMAWNIGANDVANAIGTSVGSGAISYRRAIFLAGIFEFAGAVLVGGHVVETIKKGIVDPNAPVFHHAPLLFAIGMISALLAAALWLNTATYFSLPVSTTHSIVGAVFGFGIVSAYQYVHYSKLSTVALAWVVSPLAGAILSFVIFRIIQKLIFSASSPSQATNRYAPFLTFFVGLLLSLSVIYKGLQNLHLDFSFRYALLISVLVGFIVSFFYSILLRRWRTKRVFDSYEAEIEYVEEGFKYLQIATACYVAFAHGANDVSNAIGPLAGIYACYQGAQEYAGKVMIPLWMLILGGSGIVVGLATFGRRVNETIGRKITAITPVRGFSAEFGAATTVLVCSRLGLPISTTQVLVGAVLGVGMARGIDALDIRTVRKVVANWLWEIPLTATLTIIFYSILKFLVV